MDPVQTAPIGAVCSGSTLFASILDSSVMLGSYSGLLSRLLKCLRSLYGKQRGPRSGSTLFASILNLSVMLGSYLQQTASADDIFRCIFYLAL